MLHVKLLDGLTVGLEGEPPVELESNLVGSLLAYLALDPGRVHPRERLADLLWRNDEDCATARDNLRQILRQLRIKLDRIAPGTADRVLVCTNATVRLNSEEVRTDVSEFLRLRAEAELASEPGERAAILSRTEEVYRGELLPGAYKETFEHERERLAAEYRALLQ